MSEPAQHVAARRAALSDPLGRYQRMQEIRVAEDVIRELFAAGLVAGTTHTCQGQEAVSVGIASVLRTTDVVGCTYRGHGHALALGLTPLEVLGEILGRSAGCVRGLGGSMHLTSAEAGLLPTMAIIGAGVPIAAGAAWAAQLDGRDDVAVSIFGDGASNIGAFHEGLNIAAVWKLPVVFVCENNLYGEYSPIANTTAVTDIADRAGSYGMASAIVDGQDLDAVAASMSEAVERARSGDGPTLLEMKTYRFAGHSRSDLATYRPAGELEAWQARDPLTLYARQLIASGVASEADLERAGNDARVAVDEAVELAKSSPSPTIADMFRHVTAEPHHRLAVDAL